MKIIRDTQLGEWLYQTLNIAGVTYLKYEPTLNLSLQKHVKEHLKGQHPDDIGYTPSAKAWGEYAFARYKNKSLDKDRKANKYLFQIRELCRFILEQYYLSQELIRSSKVSENFGEVWVYGNRGAKSALNELLASVTEVTGRSMNFLKSFWQEYYHEDFMSYVKTNAINLRIKPNDSLVHIQDTLLLQLEKIHTQIKEQVEDIKKNMASYANKANAIEESKIHFLECVLAHREYHDQTSGYDYRRAKKELNRLRQAHETVATAGEKEQGKQRVVNRESFIPPETQLAAVLNFLRRKKDLPLPSSFGTRDDINDTLFYSDLQRKIFHTILKKYRPLVNDQISEDFWFGALGYSSKQFADLRYFYTCLFDAFTELYYKNGRLIGMSDVEVATFKKENDMAIGIIDQELAGVVAKMEHGELLYRADSHVTKEFIHPNALIVVEVDKGFCVKQPTRYESLPIELLLKDIETIQNEKAKALLEAQKQAEEKAAQETMPESAPDPEPKLDDTAPPPSSGKEEKPTTDKTRANSSDNKMPIKSAAKYLYKNLLNINMSVFRKKAEKKDDQSDSPRAESKGV